MGLNATHTYAELELSQAAYDEIKTKLLAAGYGHALMDGGTINMHGIGVTREPAEPRDDPTCTHGVPLHQDCHKCEMAHLEQGE